MESHFKASPDGYANLAAPGSLGYWSVVCLIAFLLKLGSKSPAMSLTDEV